MLRSITTTLRVLGRRHYRVLAIETSCDDTCVALLERNPKSLKVLHHIKTTLNSTKDGGIVPTKAFEHHQANIASNVRQVLSLNSITSNDPPDIICVTRGPGMTGSLSVGIDFAKGLSVAMNRPLIGVHHMLGHLLTPRLEKNGKPEFPYLTLLASGGHTMVVLSFSLTVHKVLCDTVDTAVGDALDKCAREIGIKGNNLGKEMESFINQNPDDWNMLDAESLRMPNPMSNKPARVDTLAFSFGCFHSHLKRLLADDEMKIDLSDESIRRSLAYHVQNAIFDHLLNRIALTVRKEKNKMQGIKNFVASGGVVSNLSLRRRLDQMFKDLSAHGDCTIQKTFYPDPSLCTDNAVMIGWAGIELYEKHGIVTDAKFLPISRWPLSELKNLENLKK